MKRWSTGIIGLVLVCAAAGGCRQPIFLAETDYELADTGLPSKGLECRPNPPPATGATFLAEPATTFNPDREPWHLTLAEALALALEHGTTGVQSTRALGSSNEDLVSYTGQGIAGYDSIRVLAMNPAIAGASIETALSRFDALWTTSMSWTTTDDPLQGFSIFSNGQAATLGTSLAKELPTGGAAGVSFTNNYQLLNSAVNFGPFTFLNPSYTSRLQFGFEQPLLRNAGVDINQLLPNPVPSTLFPGLTSFKAAAGQTEGIILSRLRFDQSRAEFERNVTYLLLNVETAYWNLYGAYITLYSAEQGLLQSFTAWSISRDKYEAGSIDRGDLAASRGSYEQFRGDRLQALEQVLDSERSLRTLLGMPPNDGKRLVPIDAPTLTPYYPDWKRSVEQAMTLRPELILARGEFKARQLHVLAQQNALQPDLRFAATYTAVGLGDRLDGNGSFLDPTGTVRSTNAFRSLASDHFNDWTAGLTLNVPLGFRQEHAQLRQARLQMQQSFLTLQEQEKKAQTYLSRQYSQLFRSYHLIEMRRSQRMAYAEQAVVRLDKYREGKEKITIDFVLDAQRLWAQALSQEYQAIVDYNNTLAAFEFARGRLLQHDNITIAEGPLPRAAQMRAVDHERERARAIVLRERALPVVPDPDHAGLPALREDAPNLISLFSGRPPLPGKQEANPERSKEKGQPVTLPRPALAEMREAVLGPAAQTKEPKTPPRRSPKPTKAPPLEAEILWPETVSAKAESD